MNTSLPSRTVAANVRAEIARVGGLTHEGLARSSGMGRVTLGRRLSGESPFTIDELFSVAAVLGVRVTTLLQGVDVAAKASA